VKHEEGRMKRSHGEKKADNQFMRKSVEGLSIFLFFFAFCGNLTYVASILLNPAGSASPSDAGHYLLEALPYVPSLSDLFFIVTSLCLHFSQTRRCVADK